MVRQNLAEQARRPDLQMPLLAVLCLLGMGLTPTRALAADAARIVKYSKEDTSSRSGRRLFDPHRPSRERGDPRLHDRRQGILIINGAHNLCYVHPAQPGIRTNLNQSPQAGTCTRSF